MHVVYIIHSARLGQFYVGMTTKLRNRLKAHRAGNTRSVKASSDWDIVWSRTVASSQAARELEKRIKSRGAARFLKELEH